MKFDDFADEFLNISQTLGNSPGELAQKTMALRNHLLPFFGEMDMEHLGPADVRAYVALKTSQDYKSLTVDGHLIVFNRFLNLAREERKLVAPKFFVRKPRVVAREARYLAEDEMYALLRAAEVEGGELYSMVRFVLQTGLRIGEVLALQRTDVDPQRKFVTVRGSYDRVSRAVKCTKNGLIRAIALSDTSRRALAQLPAHGQTTIFTFSYHQAITAIKRVAQAAKLKGVGWHTLRHTFATMLVSRSIPLHTVAKLLGHKTTDMTEIYAHLSPLHNQGSVEALPSF